MSEWKPAEHSHLKAEQRVNGSGPLTYRDTSGDGLVWVAVFIGGEATGVRVAQLATGACSPRVQVTLTEDGHRVRLATGHLFYFHLPQGDDELGVGLVRAPVLVLWHRRGVWVTQLAAPSAAPRVETALISQRYGMSISAGYLHDLDCLKQIDKSWCRLVRIALNVCW